MNSFADARMIRVVPAHAEFRPHGQLLPPEQGLRRVTTSIGPGGEALSVWADHSDVVGSYGNHRKSIDHTNRVVVTVQDASMTTQATVTAEIPISVATVQPLPDGHLLLVSGRCSWDRTTGGETNAVVLDVSGTVVDQGVLGDGIAHVQTTSTGDVWVGYTDEGIYGNLGWGCPDGPTPIGAHGLNRFTSSLNLDWSFVADRERGIEPISECYALTVVDDDAWACTYTEFDVVRVRGDEIRSWSSDISGPRAMAITDDRIALLGGYGRDRDRLVLARLGQTALEDLRQSRLTLPDGDPLPERAQVAGRGADLDVVVDDTWLRLAIDQLDLG